MYLTIIHPINNKQFNINSRQGKNILKQYILEFNQNGGTRKSVRKSVRTRKTVRKTVRKTRNPVKVKKTRKMVKARKTVSKYKDTVSNINSLLKSLESDSNDALERLNTILQNILRNNNIYLVSKEGYGEYLKTLHLQQDINEALIQIAPVKKAPRIVEKLFRDMISISEINDMVLNKRQQFLKEVADVYRLAIIFHNEEEFYKNIKVIINDLNKLNIWPISYRDIIKMAEKKNKKIDKLTVQLTLNMGMKQLKALKLKKVNITDLILRKHRDMGINNLDKTSIDLTLEYMDKIPKMSEVELFKCKSFMPKGDGYTGINMVYLYNFNPGRRDIGIFTIPIEIQFHTIKTYKTKNAMLTLDIEMLQKIYTLLSQILSKDNYKKLIGDEYYNPESLVYLNSIIKKINPLWDNTIQITTRLTLKPLIIKQHRIYRLTQILDFLCKRLNNSKNNLKNNIQDISDELKTKMKENEGKLVNELYKKNNIIVEDTEIFQNKQCRYTGIRECDNRHDLTGKIKKQSELTECLDRLSSSGLITKDSLKGIEGKEGKESKEEVYEGKEGKEEVYEGKESKESKEDVYEGKEGKEGKESTEEVYRGK